MTRIVIENVTKKYDKGTQALTNVDLMVESGEFLVLLGPSGCGKTTLLRLVAGLDKPTEGRILFDGVDVVDIKPMNRNVAMVFQSFALYPHLNVYKNIAFPLKSLKLPIEEIKRRVEATAKILDIEHILNCRPRVLSGGQKQRVALARAMVREPVVFLFDEPLSNLDAKMRGEVREEIIRLHKKLGTTFIYVTHDQSEAMQMGQKVAVMNEGQVCQAGTPQQVYDYPNSVFVAGFIGSPKMNFFASYIRKNGEEFFVEVLGKRIKIDRDKVIDVNSVFDNSRIIAGVRPEDFELSVFGKEQEATVLRTVPMGSCIHVECEYDSKKFLVVTGNDSDIMHNSRISFDIKQNRLHIFDVQTRLSILKQEI